MQTNYEKTIICLVFYKTSQIPSNCISSYTIKEPCGNHVKVVWGNCCTTLINKLQHLQNCAIEIIHSDSQPADLNTAFKDLSLLNVQQMTDFNIATTVFDSIHRNCPEYLAGMFVPAQQMDNHQTRHTKNGLFPSHINRVAGQRSFLNRGCHLWSSLPHSFKDLLHNAFKQIFLNLLLDLGPCKPELKYLNALVLCL